MTQLQFLMDWAKLASPIVFWVSLLFVPAVSPFWDWWDSQWGWNIVSLEACIALALSPSNLARLFHLSLVTELWIIDIALTMIGVIIIWRFIIIFLLQFSKRRAGPDDTEEKMQIVN